MIYVLIKGLPLDDKKNSIKKYFAYDNGIYFVTNKKKFLYQTYIAFHRIDSLARLSIVWVLCIWTPEWAIIHQIANVLQQEHQGQQQQNSQLNSSWALTNYITQEKNEKK
ncbi:hypothetical protein BLOT_000804 [Blomia tropicalis]|nr:hypothetical protein BLOT_000804 [Blomia tropicalis]